MEALPCAQTLMWATISTDQPVRLSSGFHRHLWREPQPVNIFLWNTRTSMKRCDFRSQRGESLGIPNVHRLGLRCAQALGRVSSFTRRHLYRVQRVQPVMKGPWAGCARHRRCENSDTAVGREACAQAQAQVPWCANTIQSCARYGSYSLQSFVRDCITVH